MAIVNVLECPIRDSATEGTMGSSEVVEAFPLGQFLVPIDIIDIVEQLIKLLLIGPMGAFLLAAELWRARLDVDVADAFVFDMPVKLGLELLPVIGPDALHTKREHFQQ